MGKIWAARYLFSPTQYWWKNHVTYSFHLWKKKKSFLQIFSSLGVCFGHLVLGTLIGYPTIAIPQLKNELNENLKLEDELRSWFAPTFHICAIIFMMPGGILSSKFGRRKIMLFTMPFIMAGWLLIGLAQNKIMIFSGRILSNSFSCLSCTSISVYISETVHPNIRGSDGFATLN